MRDPIVKDLVDEGLIDEDQVLETHFLKAAEAYPKYSLGFEKDLQTLRNHLEPIGNLVSTGRQGAFQFTPMVPSMEMAWRDTRNSLERMEKLALSKGGAND